MPNRLIFRTSAVPIVLLLGLLLAVAPQPASAQSNKTGAASSTHQLFGPTVTGSQTAKLLTVTYQNGYTTDLDLQVHLECGLFTEQIGGYSQNGQATLTVWVEIDGVPVPVTSDSNGKPQDSSGSVGQVTFCDRTDYNANIFSGEVFVSSTHANSFEWIQRLLPAGSHEIVVRGQLNSLTATGNVAVAGVGRRTLVVEPVRISGNLHQ